MSQTRSDEVPAMAGGAGTLPAAVSDDLGLRVQRVAPFLGALLLALGLAALPPGESDRFPALAAAAGIFVAGSAVIVAFRWDRTATWPRLLVVVVFCGAVAVVRDATGGAASGFGLLLLLAVVWQAAYGRRAELAATVGLVAATMAAPVAVLGAPVYPSTEWRKVLLMAFMSALIGYIVRHLVHEVRQERGLIVTIAELSRSVASGEDPRRAICDATLEITGADVVILFEPVGESLEITHSAGIEMPPVTIPAELVSGNLRTAVETVRTQVVLDTAKGPDDTAAASDALGIRCWVHQPAARGDHRATVVLTVGWCEARRTVPARAREALPLLAAEAAAAIERAGLVDRLAELARQDPLTGLMNRRAWDDHLGREVARMARTGRPLSVAVLDLDRFKAFNDDHGHLVGDQLLKTAAGTWSQALRASDVLARWGGEEFAVLMPDTAAEEAHRVLSRLSGHTPMGQTLSAGFVTTTRAVSGDRLMAEADAAVYRAKAAGRDRVLGGDLDPEPARSSR